MPCLVQNKTKGGCTGVPPSHFEFWNPDVYGSMLATNPLAFKLKNIRQSVPQKPFEWKPGHRNSPKNIAWPPKGATVSFYYVPPAITTRYAPPPFQRHSPFLVD